MSSPRPSWRLNQGRFIGLAHHSAFTLALSTSVSSFMWPLAVSSHWTTDEWMSLRASQASRARSSLQLDALYRRYSHRICLSASRILESFQSWTEIHEEEGRRPISGSRLWSNSLKDRIGKSVHLLCSSQTGEQMRCYRCLRGCRTDAGFTVPNWNWERT